MPRYGFDIKKSLIEDKRKYKIQRIEGAHLEPQKAPTSELTIVIQKSWQYAASFGL